MIQKDPEETKFKSGFTMSQMKDFLKENTSGLGRFIETTNRETGEKAYKILYAGSKEEVQKNDHVNVINKFRSLLNDRDGIEPGIEFMSQEASDALQKRVESGINELRSR